MLENITRPRHQIPAPFIDATQIEPGVWSVLYHHKPASVTLPPRSPIASERPVDRVWVH